MQMNRLYRKFAWAPHNIIAHPLMEIMHWFGLTRLGDWLHDATIPKMERE